MPHAKTKNKGKTRKLQKILICVCCHLNVSKRASQQSEEMRKTIRNYAGLRLKSKDMMIECRLFYSVWEPNKWSEKNKYSFYYISFFGCEINRKK